MQFPLVYEERIAYRALLWEALQLFSQTEVWGPIQGHFRDENGKKIERVERGPLIAITGTQYQSGAKRDKSEVPVAVSFVAGDFFYRHRENQKMLSFFGDLDQLAEIPGGKAGGQWARSIGLALFQIWRERASKTNVTRVGEDQHLTAALGMVTRRQLFDRVVPDPNPTDVLTSEHPTRAREYWDDAIEMLRQKSVVGQIGSTKRAYPRQDWADLWLDEAIDLRPHRQNFVAIEQIQEIANGQLAFKRKRGRPKNTARTPGKAC